MQRFSIYAHMAQYDAYLPWIAERLRDGRIVYFEDIVDGRVERSRSIPSRVNAGVKVRHWPG